MVRGAGLEPASLAALEPKSRAFANFANRAEKICVTITPNAQLSSQYQIFHGNVLPA